MPPFALQDERTQPVGIIAIGVEGLDRRQKGAMRQAIAERQPPFGCPRHIILPQVGNRIGQRPVEVDPPLLRQPQHEARRCDHLGQRGEVEPVIHGQRLVMRLALREPGPANRTSAVRRNDAQRASGNAAIRYGYASRCKGLVRNMV